MHQLQTRINGIDTEALHGLAADLARDPSGGAAGFEVATRWKGGVRSDTRVDAWTMGGERRPRRFVIAADAPAELCGDDSAPSPQELLMAALNACMVAGYAAACAARGIELHSLEIRTQMDQDPRGFLGLEPGGRDELRYTVRIRGSGTAAEFQEVHDAVMASSPTLLNLSRATRLRPTLVVGARGSGGGRRLGEAEARGRGMGGART